MRPLLVWIDLETTGLSAQQDRILQAAIVITDQELRAVAEPFEVVIHRGPAVLGLMSDQVRTMHEGTGLLSRVDASRIRPEAAYSDMYTYVRENTRAASQVILAGSSVHFDRAFLAQWVPQLSALFSHRLLDVSSLKYLAEWWSYPKFRKTGVLHLAADDIRNSIAELKFYRSTMMREL